MNENEWFKAGERLLQEWRDVNDPYAITSVEESAFLYAWELAGREMGIVE